MNDKIKREAAVQEAMRYAVRAGLAESEQFESDYLRKADIFRAIAQDYEAKELTA